VRTGGLHHHEHVCRWPPACCFPWLFITANYLLNNLELGALGAGISSWYVHGVILLFFVPIGVGSAYYFIPKITGQPIHSQQLANMGFWVLAIFGGWTGCNATWQGRCRAG